jgi:DNA topoisomerase-3
MSMAQSLEIVQKLYEEGYLTYPRTDSEYLATAEKGKVKKILDNCAKLGYPVVFKDKKTIFDDSKIESHSAITPTYKIPDKSKLSEAEMQVYSTVFRRFIAVFCAEECLAQKVEITVQVGELETFVLKGMTILEKGWMKYDDASQKDKILPSLAKGDKVNIDFKPIEKETAPPKHHTIESLNNYLKIPSVRRRRWRRIRSELTTPRNTERCSTALSLAPRRRERELSITRARADTYSSRRTCILYCPTVNISSRALRE